MSWLDRLERKFGKYYIHNLMAIITVGSTITFLITQIINPAFYYHAMLIPSRVIRGEVWRLFTFIFITPTSLIFAVFALYFYYMAGMSLENEWGSFRFNVYYLIGYLATIAVSFITNTPATGVFLNLSIFLAYAKLYPDNEILLFFVIPIKIKFLGYLNWILIIANSILYVASRNFGGVLITLVPIINYLLFFLKSNYREAKMRSNSVIRMKDYKRKMKSVQKTPYRHKCEVCGITDLDDPEMDFRYCSKCSGRKCYCINHIRNHEHM